MTSGKPLSLDEKAYIDAHHKRKFPSVIARDLGNLFPEVNGGCRDDNCVKRYLRAKRKKSKRAQ